jgi:timeless protein
METHQSKIICLCRFATIDVMQRYGRLLENYEYNNPVVNNCIFTMMHHIAGDCEKPTALLQVQILRTYLEILDSNTPLSQVRYQTNLSV